MTNVPHEAGSGAAQSDRAAFYPRRKLKTGGEGAKVRKRPGDREVLELTNAGDGYVRALTVYATASAAAQAAGG